MGSMLPYIAYMDPMGNLFEASHPVSNLSTSESLAENETSALGRSRNTPGKASVMVFQFVI